MTKIFQDWIQDIFDPANLHLWSKLDKIYAGLVMIYVY